MPFPLTWEIVDESGDAGDFTVYVPDGGFNASDYEEFAQAYAPLLDGVIQGRIAAAKLNLDVNTSGLTVNVTDASADVEDKGKFEFVTAGGDRTKMQVPGINELDVVPGTDQLDPTDAAVSAFIDAMENGIVTLGGTISPCNKGEDDIVGTLFARRGFTGRPNRS